MLVLLVMSNASGFGDKPPMEFVKTHIHAAVSFLYLIAFIIAYYAKNILAWWLGFLFFPVTWSIYYAIHWPPESWMPLIVTSIGWFLFIFTYFCDRYKSYKNYIGKEARRRIHPSHDSE